MIFFAFYAACYKHKASEEDREKYIQLLDEDDELRSVLEQSRSIWQMTFAIRKRGLLFQNFSLARASVA